VDDPDAVAVMEDDADSVDVGVVVAVAEAVAVGVWVAELVPVGVCVCVAVAVTLPVGVHVPLALTLPDALTDAEPVLVPVGVWVCVWVLVVVPVDERVAVSAYRAKTRLSAVETHNTSFPTHLTPWRSEWTTLRWTRMPLASAFHSLTQMACRLLCSWASGFECCSTCTHTHTSQL